MQQIFPEWRNDNQYSRYPFSDSATLTSESGKVLDQDIILDLIIHMIGAEVPVYLSEIASDGVSASITFSSLNRNRNGSK